MEKKSKRGSKSKVLRMPPKRGPASDHIDNYIDMVNNMTPDDVQKMAGAASKLAPHLMQQGPLFTGTLDFLQPPEPPAEYKHAAAAQTIDHLTVAAARAHTLGWSAVVARCLEMVTEVITPPKVVEEVKTEEEPLEEVQPAGD